MALSREELVTAMGFLSRIDGIVLKLPAMPRANYTPMVEALRAEFEELCGFGTTPDMRIRLYNMDTADDVKVVKVQFWGEQANIAASLLLSWGIYLDEVHYKTYLAPVNEESMGVMMRELYDAPLGRKARMTSNNRSKGNLRQRSEGLAVGDKDSAHEFVWYRRNEGHRVGVEVRLKGKGLNILKADAENTRAVVERGSPYAMRLWFLLQKCSDKVWKEFFAEVERKGVDLGDYVRMLGPVPFADTEMPVAYSPITGDMLSFSHFDGQVSQYYTYETLEAYQRGNDED